MYKHILVPTDGSALSTETISSAVDFARDAKARITFFHATPDYLATSDGIVLHSIAPQAASEQATGNAHAILSKAAVVARGAGVECDMLYMVSDRPYEAILEAAEKQGCDLIFTSSRGPKSIGGLLLGSETLKVLMHANIPVLVASVQKNSPTPDLNKAISILKDEHRSLAAVLHGMKQVMEKAVDGKTVADLPLLQTMLFYIREFPEKLHHPKEDRYLFSRLRQRTGSVDEVIGELERQHADHALLVQLEQAFANYAAHPAKGGVAFTQALTAYSAHEWQHMSLEENVILPAAREHLLPEDWALIADAFGKNGDPRFAAARDRPFHDMFVQIARLSHADLARKG